MRGPYNFRTNIRFVDRAMQHLAELNNRRQSTSTMRSRKSKTLCRIKSNRNIFAAKVYYCTWQSNSSRSKETHGSLYFILADGLERTHVIADNLHHCCENLEASKVDHSAAVTVRHYRGYALHKWSAFMQEFDICIDNTYAYLCNFFSLLFKLFWTHSITEWNSDAAQPKST